MYYATAVRAGVSTIAVESVITRGRVFRVGANTAVTDIIGANIAVITVGILATGDRAARGTIDGAVFTSLAAIAGSIATVVAGAGDTHILGRAGATTIGLAVVGPADQPRGAFRIGVTVTLAF
jgi:hypothetical protein